MEKQEIKEELINVIEKYGFKVIAIDKTPSGINGYLAILDKEDNYIFVRCEKEIEDVDSEKKIKLTLRYEITYCNYEKENGIGFDYATGGNSPHVVRKKEDIEEIFRDSLRCHNLYSYEELDKLKNKNNTITLFDFV